MRFGNGRATATLAAAVLTSAFLAALAPAANATTTVSYVPSGDRAGLRIEAGPAVSTAPDLLTVSFLGGENFLDGNLPGENTVRVSGQFSSAPVISGPGCRRVISNTGEDRTVECPRVGVRIVTADLGVGDDMLLVALPKDLIAPARCVCRGGPGNDVIEGSTDADVIDGEDGIDRLSGGEGNDQLTGGLGNDQLTGGSGNDTLDGGVGGDVLSGEDGNDVLLARDGVDDQRQRSFLCGRGIDAVRADLKDDDTRPIPADCESVDQSDRREGPNVAVRSRSVSVGGDGALSVRLSCPRKLRKRCSGTLAARVDKRGSGFGRPTRYSIRPGRSASVKARLRASQRAASRRRGARVALRSLERGLHGTKTTLRSLPTRRA